MANWFTTETTQGIRTLEDRTAGLEPLQRSIRTYLKIKDDVSILDIGCAEGLIGDWVTLGKAKKLVGIEGDRIKVDSANQMYAHLIQENRYKFIKADANDIDHACRANGVDQKYDIVLLLAILQKLADPLPCLKQAIARADGFVAIRAPQYFWDQYREDIKTLMAGWEIMYEVPPTADDEEHRGRLIVWQTDKLRNKLDRIKAEMRSISKTEFLAKCDYPIVSFPKSGRTWIRYFLGQYLNIEYGMPMDLEFMPQPYWTQERHDLDFPGIYFTHDWFDTRHSDRANPGVFFKDILDKKPMILLLRNPMDTIVSYYYHKVKREERENQLRLELRQFILDDRYGLGRYCAWMDAMLDYMQSRSNTLTITYEDMIKDMSYEMNRMFDFMKIREHRKTIPLAAAESGFNSMQKAEIQANTDPNTAGIGRLGMQGWDGHPDRLKVRKGKIGSWKEELSLDENFMRGLVAGDDRIKVYLTRIKRRFPQCMVGLEHLVR